MLTSVSACGDASRSGAQALLAAAAVFAFVSVGGDASPSAQAPSPATTVSTPVSVGGDAFPNAQALLAAAVVSMGEHSVPALSSVVYVFFGGGARI